MNELGDMLKMLKSIVDGDGRAKDLTRDFGISVTTLRRRIADLRHLGVVIVPVRASGAKTGHWKYEVKNWEQVKPTVEKWSHLESERDQLRLC